jgi:hypothetical protein
MLNEAVDTAINDPLNSLAASPRSFTIAAR